MTTTRTRSDIAALTLKVIARPNLWIMWPMLPVTRQTGAGLEIGTLLDTRAMGLTGYSSTVFNVNVYDLPDGVTFCDVTALPKEVYDSAEEVVVAGWIID